MLYKVSFKENLGSSGNKVFEKKIMLYYSEPERATFSVCIFFLSSELSGKEGFGNEW